MRYLCIDLGERRTGLAAGDDETGLVAPLDVVQLPKGEPLVQTLLKSIRDQGPAALVLGLPVNMDGSEGSAARSVREFGQNLRDRTGLPVYYQDERLTSYAADQAMARSGRTRKQKKELRDALAAAEILRDFLHARSSEPS